LGSWRWWAAALGAALVASLLLHLTAAAAVWLTGLYRHGEEQYVPPVHDPEVYQSTADDVRRDKLRQLGAKARKAREALAAVVELRDARLAELRRRRGVDLAPPGPRSEAGGAEAPAAGGLAGLYDGCRQVELACQGAYETFRAAELVDKQGVPAGQALAASRMAAPPRRRADARALDGPVRSAEAFRAFAAEVTFVTNEIEAMAVAAARIRDVMDNLASPLPRGNGYTPEPVVDPVQPGGGGGLSGAQAGPPLSGEWLFPPYQQTALLQSPGFRPQPGRKITDAGEPTDWMYVDRWYCVGPFPNPQRGNLARKFPPERGAVDLDAAYVGKGDRTVRWRALRSPTLCVAPLQPDAFAIYYLTSEIRCDREGDYWLAFGSDDFGRCWVNGHLVYESGTRPHHWIPDRALAKVRLRAGPNRVLFKLENAGGTTGFSLAVLTRPRPQGNM